MFSKYLWILFICLPSINAWGKALGDFDTPYEENLYDGFFIRASLGLGEIKHPSFLQPPKTTPLGLGIGYDYFFLENIGLGFSAKASYHYQISDGSDVGGTYSGLNLNPINPRLSFSFLSIAMAFEYHLYSSYEVSKPTVDGDTIRWSQGPGYAIIFSLPWKILGGNFGVVYQHQTFEKEQIADVFSNVKTLGLNEFLMQIEFRSFFEPDPYSF